MKLYAYVGPERIRAAAVGAPAGEAIRSAADLARWLGAQGGDTAATFVIDRDGHLRIADRRSEHVACAGGDAVQSAGEIFFDGGAAVEVTNLSTGYCPEPSSWPAVARALDRAGIDHPGGFTVELEFRRCPACGERNLIKDGVLVCAICDAELPAGWNF